MKTATFSVISVAALLAGCASTIESFFSRPANVDSIEVDEKSGKSAATVALDATRRVAIINRMSKADPDGINVCSEPPPDSVANLVAESALKLNASSRGSTAGLETEDSLKRTNVLLAKRTERIDAYRVFAFTLCQLHANGLDSTAVAEIFANGSEIILRGVDGSSNESSGVSSDEARAANKNSESPKSGASDPDSTH